MSKDMRDWPRANLGVAVNMFKHMLVTGCTNSAWVWNVDKSWGAFRMPWIPCWNSRKGEGELCAATRVQRLCSCRLGIPSRNLHIPGSNPSGIWWYLFVVTRWRWSDSNALIGEFSWLSGRNRSCFMSIQENFEVVSWAQLCFCGLRFLTQAQLDFDTLPWLAVVRFLSRICLDLSSVMNAKINTCLQCFLLLDIQEEKSCFHLRGFYLASSSFLYQYSNQTCRLMISPLKPPGTTGRLSHPRPYPSRCRITRWSNSEACDINRFNLSMCFYYC